MSGLETDLAFVLAFLQTAERLLPAAGEPAAVSRSRAWVLSGRLQLIVEAGPCSVLSSSSRSLALHR